MSRRAAAIGPDYFEALYRATADPWDFATSPYEQEKYAASLAVLDPYIGRALEIGCSIGVFTQMLAARCDRLVAVDVSETALSAARARCRTLAMIDFRLLHLPREIPAERSFDLVTLSEVGYYWTRRELDMVADWLRGVLAPGGSLLAVHWTGATDYPLTADEVHDHLIERTADFLACETSSRTASYRLDLLRRTRA